MLMEVEYWFKNYFEIFYRKIKMQLKVLTAFYIYIFYESDVKLS